MKSQVIKIPLRDGAVGSKRMYPQEGHWLELTCPHCGEVAIDGTETPIFYGGNKKGHFYCHSCDHEHSNAFSLSSIEMGDDVNYAIITKDNNFVGTIAHCYNVRTISEEI